MSSVLIPDLKSTPVMVAVEASEPAAMTEVVAIVFAGAGTLTDRTELSFSGAVPYAEVFACTVIVPAAAVPLKNILSSVELRR